MSFSIEQTFGPWAVGIVTEGAITFRTLQASDGETPAPGSSPTVFAIQPDYHWHPNTASQTLGAGNRIITETAIHGPSNIAEPSSGAGAFLVTDPIDGIKEWLFNGNTTSLVADNNLIVADTRQVTWAIVARVYRQREDQSSMIAPRFFTYTSPTVNTVPTSATTFMRTLKADTNAIPSLQGAQAPLTWNTNAANAWQVVPGCQWQVIIVSCRTTANGGTRLVIDNMVCDVAQTASFLNTIGAVFGGRSTASNSSAVTVSANNAMSIREAMCWNRSLTNAEVDAIRLACQDNHAILNQIGCIFSPGDSITEGVATGDLPINSANCSAYFGSIAAQCVQPQQNLWPKGYRVINVGVAGTTISGLNSRKDSTYGWASSYGLFQGGENIAVVQTGANDWGGAGTAASVYTAIKETIDSANKGVPDSTGLFQRGIKCALVSNIGDTNGTRQAKIEAYRALIMDSGTLGPSADLLTATRSGPGGTFEGMLTIVPASEIVWNGYTPFKSGANVTQAIADGLYSTDGQHPSLLGNTVLAGGGSTPAYAYGAVR